MVRGLVDVDVCIILHYFLFGKISDRPNPFCCHIFIFILQISQEEKHLLI